MNDPTHGSAGMASSQAENAEVLALLLRLPDAAGGASVRVAHRLAKTRARRSSPYRFAAVAAGSLGVAAMAAAAVLSVVVSNPEVPAPVAVEAALASEAGWAQQTFDGMALSFRGAGSVGGTDLAPRIDWQRGVLNVEVTSGLGLDVRVATREADVRVVGTGFTVTRDALGTRVDVRHGKVETQCGEEPVLVLGAGDSTTCMPLSAAGLLGRSRALAEAEVGDADVLRTIDRGLRLAGSGTAVGDELLAMRLDVLARSGRSAEALAAAKALLESGGGVRRDEAIGLAAQVAVQLGGCATVAPWLLDLGPAAQAACGN